MSELLKSNHIMKAFGSGNDHRNVLDDISVRIEEGEFISVMGASGSGKSTLLYALSGMDTIDSGEITFEGRKLSGLSDNVLSDLRRNRMGFVFQQPTLLKNLNILDNILLPQMRDHHRDMKKLYGRAESLMELAGIADLGQRNITQVSGGQLQRAGICRALMSSPRILFADEPTGALNSKSSDDIMALFSEIHKNGTAVLLVTHDVKTAARAQRVLFMQDGRIVSSLMLSRSDSRNTAPETEKIMAEMKRIGI